MIAERGPNPAFEGFRPSADQTFTGGCGSPARTTRPPWARRVAASRCSSIAERPTLIVRVGPTPRRKRHCGLRRRHRRRGGPDAGAGGPGGTVSLSWSAILSPEPSRGASTVAHPPKSVPTHFIAQRSAPELRGSRYVPDTQREYADVQHKLILPYRPSPRTVAWRTPDRTGESLRRTSRHRPLPLVTSRAHSPRRAEPRTRRRPPRGMCAPRNVTNGRGEPG
jgi:hypothetical protein